MSLDVGTAFDDVEHEVTREALLHRGVHPLIVRASMLQYYDQQARLTVADGDPTDFFSFRRGGRQGGAETPDLFNLVVEAAVSAVVGKWRRQGDGFTWAARTS